MKVKQLIKELKMMPQNLEVCCYICGPPMDEDVSVEQEENEYYTEDDAADLVYDIEQLREYIYGLDDAIVDGMYKKEYVDTFSNR